MKLGGAEPSTMGILAYFVCFLPISWISTCLEAMNTEVAASGEESCPPSSLGSFLCSVAS